MSDQQPYPPAQPHAPQAQPQQPYPPQPYPPQPYPQQPPYAQPYPPQTMPQQRPYAAAPEVRRDVDAALAARRELGGEYEDHVAAGLAERVEQLAAVRSSELQRAADGSGWQQSDDAIKRRQRFTLGIISLGAAIPITAISAVQVHPGLLGVIVSWAGIVGVNAVFAWNDRKR